MTTALDTFGTTLTLNGVGIINMGDIDGPQISRDTVDISTHSSPEQWEEMMATMKRSGNVGFTLVFVPLNAVHIALYTSLDDGTLDAYQLRAPDATGWDYNALVTALGEVYPIAGFLARAVTMKVSGKLTRV